MGNEEQRETDEEQPGTDAGEAVNSQRETAATDGQQDTIPADSQQDTTPETAVEGQVADSQQETATTDDQRDTTTADSQQDTTPETEVEGQVADSGGEVSAAEAIAPLLRNGLEKVVDTSGEASAAAEAGAAAADAIEAAEELEVAEISFEGLLEELNKARDAALRAAAEAQNARRRAEQDVEKARKFALERFAGELLPVVDNLERAIEAAVDAEDETVKPLAEGVELTHKSLIDVLVRHKVEVIDPVGEPFDPNLHQAITMLPNPDMEPNTVMEVMQKGYSLSGRLLRPAMVVVSRDNSD